MIPNHCNHRRASAPTSSVNVSLGAQRDRERPHAIIPWRLLRCALGLAAITALAACGEGDPLISTAGAGTSSVKPTVNLQLTPNTVAMGQSATLTWSASDAQSCTASGGWSGVQPTTGRLSTAPLTASTSYTLTCMGSGGSAAQSQQVVVTHPAPVIKLAASPTTIGNLDSSTLTWFASNAEECTASGGWHGPLATSGTWSTGKLSNTTEYELTCKGQWGSATQSVTVTVTAQSPAVTLQASPSSLRSGDSSTLTWSSQNATSCTASGAWSGSKGVSGSQSTGAVKENSIYTLTCTGFGGSATQSCDGVRDVVGAHGQSQRGSEHGRLRRQLNPDLVLHQCDRLYRLRRLVGQQGDQRHPVDGRAHEQCDLHPDLYRPRRQCGPVHDGFRQGTAPHRDPQRGSERH